MRVPVVLLALVLAAAACSTERPGLVAPDIIYLATPEQVGLEMLRLAGVTGDDLVYDLGSGDGRLVLTAVRDFGARGVGVEIDAALVQRAARARPGPLSTIARASSGRICSPPTSGKPASSPSICATTSTCACAPSSCAS